MLFCSHLVPEILVSVSLFRPLLLTPPQGVGLFTMAQWVKNPPTMHERHRRGRFDPWVRKIHPLEKEGNGNPLQYSCLGNPMDRGAWWATVHGVAKSQTRLSKYAATAREGSPKVARVEYFSPSYIFFYSAFSWLLPYQCITYLMGLQTI